VKNITDENWFVVLFDSYRNLQQLLVLWLSATSWRDDMSVSRHPSSTLWLTNECVKLKGPISARIKPNSTKRDGDQRAKKTNNPSIHLILGKTVRCTYVSFLNIYAIAKIRHPRRNRNVRHILVNKGTHLIGAIFKFNLLNNSWSSISFESTEFTDELHKYGEYYEFGICDRLTR
jgi:hypothetical protein